MAAKRAERLVNLVIALLSTRQYVTAARIRATVPGYEPDDGTDRADEAFKRMFERDKAELREMGVPLETGRTSVFDTEDGYRIARADYELPEIQLTGEEAAAVGLALRLWESAQLAGAAQSALVKLRAAGVDVDAGGGIPLQPRLDAGEPAFEPVLRRRPRPPRARASTTGVPTRTPPPAGACSRGASSPGTAAGTWSASTSTGSAAGVPALPRRRHAEGRPARPGRSSRRPTSTWPPWSPARSAGRSTWSWSAPGPAPPSACAAGPRRWARPRTADDRLELRTTEPWAAGRPARRLGRRRRRRVARRGARGRDRPADPAGRDGGAGMSTTGTTDRMTRLLALIPYLTARPGGVRVQEAARDFGVTERQLRSDLELLWMCGLPGPRARATSSTSPSRATGCTSPSPPAWSARCG